jgi:hypothetical protein
MVEAFRSCNGREEAVELAVEKRSGDDWAAIVRLKLEPGEVFDVSDALVRACNLLLGGSK